MRHFDEIYAIAAERKGGRDVLDALISDAGVSSPATTDDRWLAIFSRHVFSAGFNWKVIETKWPGFETAFHGFDVGRCAMMNDDWLDQLLQDRGIVRHGAKIMSVRDNAVMLLGLAAEGGSAAKVITDWPATDYAGLLQMLKAKGGRLGGATAQYALRSGGRDGYVLSRDVVGRLIAEGVIDKAPTSKSAMAKVQEAFNIWSAQSGRGLTAISRTLALSTG